MSDYQETLRQHARLAILRALEDAPRYTSNLSMLTTILPGFGISFTRDQTKTELGWLEEQGLIETETMRAVVIVTATVRGIEVAQGIARHPDIQRPRPGA